VTRQSAADRFPHPAYLNLRGSTHWLPRLLPKPTPKHDTPLRWGCVPGGREFGVDALKSQGEIEAAVCDAVARFQQEYMGRGPRHVHTHLVDNKLFVHLEGVLTAAEQRLMDGHGNGNGRGAELLKQLRSHLVLAGKAMLDTLVRNATGSQPVSVHHDISPTTGEEVLVFTLAAAPQCRCRGGPNDRRRR
jgi:uncharacterized protein YbcI